MRKTESRIDRGFSKIFGRPAKARVQPGELAAKLVKEMEDHVASRFARVYAPNLFNIYLCRDDYARLLPSQSELVRMLEDVVRRHALRSSYQMMGKPAVALNMDPDLRPGQFGILAELGQGGAEAAGPLPAAAPSVAPASLPADAAPVATSPAVVAETAPEAGWGAALRPVEPEVSLPQVVLRQDGRSMPFTKARVIVGRSRDADLRVNDPNVSRRHAMIYWDGGRPFLKDLGSTNGTLLNGRQVSTRQLAPGDVITIGASQITVETAR